MTTLSVTLDVLLIMISGAAMLYCWQLSRRLKALHDLKSGLGGAVIKLSEAITASRQAASEISDSAASTVNELNATLEKVSAYRQEAEDLLENLDGQIHHAKSKVGQSLKSAQVIADRLHEMTERSKVEMKALTQGVEIANKVNALTRSAALQNIRQRKSSRVETLRDDVPPHGRTDDGFNPFKRAVGDL